jgi:hypothetical protein
MYRTASRASIDFMTPQQMHAVAWISRQLAWERRLAQLRFEALVAKAGGDLPRGEVPAGSESTRPGAPDPTPTAA